MKLTLNALFDYINNDGIFTYLNEFDVPWKNAVDFDLLDLDQGIIKLNWLSYFIKRISLNGTNYGQV